MTEGAAALDGLLDRATPVARIVPYDAEALAVRHATRRPRDLRL